METKTAENPRLRLRCPSCGMRLGDMPDFPASIPCDGCGFTITSEADYWDACADESFPRDFARQWILWEEGRLGSRDWVYGYDPEFRFREFLTHTSLRPEQLASKRVLEVGFGHGRLLQKIQERCPAAYGIDLSRPVQSAHLRPGSAIFGNLLSIPLMPGQFDLVISRGALHCTPDPEASFGLVADQVAEGGVFYFAGCYEPGHQYIVELRRILPWSWRYPEPVLLFLASFFGGLRSILQGIRERKLDPESLRQYYARYKLLVFDVITPTWLVRLGPETVIPWFTSRGFQAHRVSHGDYVGVKADTPVKLAPASTADRP